VAIHIFKGAAQSPHLRIAVGLAQDESYNRQPSPPLTTHKPFNPLEADWILRRFVTTAYLTNNGSFVP
jgi:hypothetical protein